MNEKYDIIETIAYFFKCCSCGKNVSEDSIMEHPSSERIFDCPHCNKIETPTQKPKEKRLCVVYLASNGKEIMNREAWHNATMKRYEMKEDYQHYELANI